MTTTRPHSDSLAPFAALHTPGPTRPVWGSGIIDPEKPIRILRPLMRPLTRIMRPKTRRAQRGGA